MREDYRSNRRFHVFKSVTRKFVLIDRSISNDWQLYTSSINEFALKLIAFGVFENETWFESDDFTKAEKKIIIDAMSLVEHQIENKETMYRIAKSDNQKNYQLVRYTDKWQFYKIEKGNKFLGESLKLLFEAYSEEEYQMKKEILNVSDDDIEKIEICYFDDNCEIKYEIKNLNDRRIAREIEELLEHAMKK